MPKSRNPCRSDLPRQGDRYKKPFRVIYTKGLEISGAAGEIRTPGLQVRSLLLYPAELQPHPRNVSTLVTVGRQALFSELLNF